MEFLNPWKQSWDGSGSLGLSIHLVHTTDLSSDGGDLRDRGTQFILFGFPQLIFPYSFGFLG